MRITALIENEKKEGFACEHGLAIHIEYNDKQYLLDSGGSELFIKNAMNLGIRLEEVDKAVLSHSHYDHAGGFQSFFEINTTADLFLQQSAKELCYEKIGPLSKYIGIPKNIMTDYGKRLCFIAGDYELDPGVTIVHHSSPGLSEIGKKAKMYRKVNIYSPYFADDFSHEQSLVFHTPQGMVIFNSCCHGGADVVVREVKNAFPGKEVLALIGGFHLMGLLGPSTMAAGSFSQGVYQSGKKKVQTLARNLKDLGVKHIYTGHCTGAPAFQILKEELGERVQHFSTGMVLEWLN